MRVLIAAICVGTAVALAAPAQGIGVSAKLKAKKIIADLVPAYSPASTGPGTGDDEGDSPAILASPVPRSNCTFDKGKVIFLVGKDTKIQLKNVKCGGTSFSGSLCAHTKTLTTIMDEDFDKKGIVTPKVCLSPAGTETQDTLQWVTGNVGTISCSNGKCKGTIGPVTDDPCPDVDKVSELRRVEVFDGPDLGSTVIQGATLASCCGPGQVVAGPILATLTSPCNSSTQDVMAEMGYVVQGVQPK